MDVARSCPLLLTLALLSEACGVGDAAEERAHDAPAAQIHDPRQYVAPEPSLCGERERPQDVLLDLGRAVDVRRAGERVFTRSDTRWILWDARSRAQVATGPCRPASRSVRGRRVAVIPPVVLAGNTLAIVKEDFKVDLRDAGDGRLLTTLPTFGRTADVALAPDGSYFAEADLEGVRISSREGKLLYTNTSSSYRDAALHTEVEVLWIASAAQGTSQIEAVDVASGRSTKREVPGDFEAWFADGKHFIVNADGVRRIYTREGTLVQTITPPAGYYGGSGGGFGRFVWLKLSSSSDDAGALYLYDITAAEPLTSYATDALPIATRAGTVGLLNDRRGLLVRIDLTGSDPSFSEHAITAKQLDAYVEDVYGRWSVAGDGAVFEPGEGALPWKLRTLGCGAVRDIATARSGRVAVATADGNVRVFDDGARGAPTLMLAHASSQISLSGDGRVLLAHHERGLDRSLRAFELPSGAVVAEWKYAARAAQVLRGFAISDDGTRVARRECVPESASEEARGCTVHVSMLAGSSLYSVDAGPYGEQPPAREIAFSPRGDRVAFSTRVAGEGAETMIADERGGVAPRRVRGGFGIWLDDARLLVRTSPGAAILDPSGTSLMSPALPEVQALYPIDPTHFLATSALNAVVYQLPHLTLAYRGEPVGAAGATADTLLFEIDTYLKAVRFR